MLHVHVHVSPHYMYMYLMYMYLRSTHHVHVMRSTDCELLEDFDPLMQSSSSHISSPSPSALPIDTAVELTVTNASPKQSPALLKNSPFHTTDDTNPFERPPSPDDSPLQRSSQTLTSKVLMKHCISDTNLHQLKQEHKPVEHDLVDSLITRSEEDLTATTSDPSSRHCVANPPHTQLTGHKHAGSRGGRAGRKKHDEDQLSQSLFFVHLEENEDNDVMTINDYFKTSEQRQVRSTETSPTMGRSTETSPVMGRKGISKLGPKHKLEFLNPSGIKAVTNKTNSRSPDIRLNRKGLSRSRERSKSAAVPHVNAKCSQWVSRYRPGVAVPIPGATARESIMQSELRHREKEFCTPVQLRYGPLPPPPLLLLITCVPLPSHSLPVSPSPPLITCVPLPSPSLPAYPQGILCYMECKWACPSTHIGPVGEGVWG